MAHYEEFTIDQGSDVAIEVHLVEKDGSKKNLTGYEAIAKMKLNFNDDSAVSFGAIIASPATDGVVTLSLTNLQTDLLTPKKRYVYDVEIKHQSDSDGSGGAIYTIERVLEGNIYVTPSVTK